MRKPKPVSSTLSPAPATAVKDPTKFTHVVMMLHMDHPRNKSAQWVGYESRPPAADFAKRMNAAGMKSTVYKLVED